MYVFVHITSITFKYAYLPISLTSVCIYIIFSVCLYRADRHVSEQGSWTKKEHYYCDCERRLLLYFVFVMDFCTYLYIYIKM